MTDSTALVPHKRDALTAEVICGRTEGMCKCLKPQGHDGVCVCGIPQPDGRDCGGSWHYEDDGHMMPDTWCGSGEPVTPESLVSHMFGPSGLFGGGGLFGGSLW